MIRLGEEKGTLKDWVCMEESRLAALGLAVVKRGASGPFSPTRPHIVAFLPLLSDSHSTACCPPQILGNACTLASLRGQIFHDFFIFPIPWMQLLDPTPAPCK